MARGSRLMHERALHRHLVVEPESASEMAALWRANRRRLSDDLAERRVRGVAMGLSTNATYLDHRKGKVLLESGLDFLVISMDGASPDTYDRIRVGGDFATTVKNVRAFFDLYKQLPNRLTVVVQMIVT